MKVIDNRKQNEAITLNDLPLGQTYLDGDGILCIKTAEASLDGCCCCLAYVNDEWDYIEEYSDVKVTPIATTLTIEK